LEPDLIESLRASTREVLETMALTTPDSVELVDPAAGDSTYSREVVGVLGFTGTRSGTVAVTATEGMTKTIAARMLMMEPDEIEDFGEAADAFGEVVNMISGSFKNSWVAKGNEMELSIPTVVRGGDLLVNKRNGEADCRLHISISNETLEVLIFFEGDGN